MQFPLHPFSINRTALLHILSHRYMLLKIPKSRLSRRDTMRGISPIVGSIRRGCLRSLLASPSSAANPHGQYRSYEGIANSRVPEIKARSTADEFARLAKAKTKEILEDAKGPLGFVSQPTKGDRKESMKANVEKLN